MFIELKAIYHPTNTLLFQCDSALSKDIILIFCKTSLTIYEHIPADKFFVICTPYNVVLAKTYFEGCGIQWDENDPEGKIISTLDSTIETIEFKSNSSKQEFNWDQHKGFL